MTRVIWLVSALSLAGCTWDESVTNRHEALGGAAGLAEAGGGSAALEPSEGGAAGAVSVGEAGADADPGGAAGAPPGGSEGGASGSAGATAGAGAATGGRVGHGGASGVSGAASGGTAGAPPSDPDCLPSNLHALPAKCADRQPIDCSLGIATNPNLCTGGEGLCADDAAKECRVYVDDFSLCRDGRFRSCPGGTCGTTAGDKCQVMQSDGTTPEFCPCVVMGVAVPKG